MQQLFNSVDPLYKTPQGAVQAGAPVKLTLSIPEDYGFVEPRLVLTKDEGEPTEYRMPFTGCASGRNMFSITISLPETGLYFYYFDLYSDYRKLFRGELGCAELTGETGKSWQLTVYEADFATPDSLKGGVMYQIFPDRFFEGNPDPVMPFADRVYRQNKMGEPYFWPTENGGQLNMDYFGGDFEGMRQKLPYLKDLGVSWIYLNPIFEAHANHRYNTADYLTADPLLGTNEEFSALCREAKALGIHIILDGVFSHTGSDSLYFNREARYGWGGAYNDNKSPYRSWYDFDSKYESGYRSWWGFDTLPEVVEEDPNYRNFICGEGGVIDTWLNLGASGFRLDVADELPDDFIEDIRKAIKAHGPEYCLLGEVWEDASTKHAYGSRRTYLLGKGLDSVMNYPFRNAALGFVHGQRMEQVAEQILSICDHYPAPALHTMMNFMSTHDTERALTAIGDEPSVGRDRYWQSGRRLTGTLYEHALQQMRLAYALIFTLPGVPSIYYGDEVAMQGYRDPFNRGYFDWNSTEHRLIPQLRKLAQLRQTCDAFKDGHLELVTARGNVLHFRRVGKTQTAEVVLNRGQRLLCTNVFGRPAEISPLGFTVQVQDNK